jgi:uncharacterized protein YaaW (UPF0174 family)
MTDTTATVSPAETMESIRQGDLYALFSVCDNDDLAPLVETITGRMTNFLDVSDEYKEHFPDHSKYHTKLADEIRLFGGNTIRNIFRGSGPAYDEILLDVCKKLEVPCEKGNVLKNESNLLTIFLERQWKTLDEQERAEVMASARKNASGQLSSLKNITKAGVFLAVTRIHPIGWGGFVYDLAEPAFRVTVPCVLHIAYLRRKILEANDALPDLIDDTVLLDESVPASPAAASLVISDSEDQPVLSMAQVSDPGQRSWRELSGQDEGISRLSPLMAGVPALATLHNVSTTKYMEVVINGDLIETATGDGFRAMAKGLDGKFLEHATLFNPTDLTAIVSGGAVFQMVSFVVAQKHLADISRKLDDIKTAVTGIKLFLEDERRSSVVGAIRYMEQVAQSVSEGELSDSIRFQIESHEAKLLDVQEHLLAEIHREIEHIQDIKDEDVFGTEGFENAINEQQQLIVSLYQQFLLSIRARGCAWQLLSMFPGEDRLKQNRKQDIQNAISMLDDGGELLVRTDALMQKKIGELKSTWNKKLADNKRKLSLSEWNETTLQQISTTRTQIENDLATAEALVIARQKPTKVLLRVEDDQIVAISPA